jgi:hypothetical protein
LPDGESLWGRWNANGPGTARLFYELGLGRNFTSFSAARPGDFLKIFWTDAVGKNENGHSVIFLGLERWTEWKRFGFGPAIARPDSAKAQCRARGRASNFRDWNTRKISIENAPKSDWYPPASSTESSFREAAEMSGIETR